MSEKIDDTARETILSLLEKGRVMVVQITDDLSLHDQEKLARCVISYLDAANTVLGGHSNLHNELIEHVDFMVLRKFARRWRR